MVDPTLPRRFVNPAFSDTQDNIGVGCIGLLCSVAGVVRVKGTANREGTYADITVQAGQIVPGEFARVYASTTTVPAGSITALYRQ